MPNLCCDGRWRCAGGLRPPRRDSREWPRARDAAGATASLASISSSAADSMLNRRMRARRLREFPRAICRRRKKRRARPATPARAAGGKARRRKRCRIRCPGAPASAGWKDWSWPLPRNKCVCGMAPERAIELAIGAGDGGGAVNIGRSAGAGGNLARGERLRSKGQLARRENPGV